jgi:hypothetical protein
MGMILYITGINLNSKFTMTTVLCHADMVHPTWIRVVEEISDSIIWEDLLQSNKRESYASLVCLVGKIRGQVNDQIRALNMFPRR